MATELASQPTADLFAANQIGMGLKQVQPDAPDVKQTTSLNASFGAAAGQSYDTRTPAVTATISPVTGLQVNAPSPVKVDNDNKIEIAERAQNAGDSLSGMQGVKAEAPKGDIGYAGGQAMKLGGELFAGIGKLFGGDKEPEVEAPKAAAPQVAFNTGAGGMPSPGGMG